MNSFTIDNAVFEIPGFFRVGLLPTSGDLPPIAIGPHNIPIIGVPVGNGQEFRLMVRLREDNRAEAGRYPVN